MIWMILGIAGLVLVAVVVYDLLQTRHAILRNFPVIGHFRYWLEAIGPELRQYIVTNNDEERPFSRDQRRWVYASAKRQNNYFGFGTDNDLDTSPNYVVIKHSAFPYRDDRKDEKSRVPCAKVMGAARERAKAFRPDSIVGVSGMSFGSLSGPAIEALNRGCAIAGCTHNTGEGGISTYHRHGGDLIWQIGTGYFGCRDEQGEFSLDRLKATLAESPTVRALEIKLSQGAKPGKGGILPAAKISAEISRVRGIPQGRDCESPAFHRAFSDADSLLDFVEHLADATGLPVGIKSAVGESKFWVDLAELMSRGDRGVDFIAVDGGEGGTGAAPLVFSDHVSLPFRIGFPRVYGEFAERGLHRDVFFFGSGRLGFPETTLVSFALGCDAVLVAREAMLAIGCIQAQRCHTDHCPTGVATQNKWLVRGLDPNDKATRLADYVMTLRKEVLAVTHACGLAHPALIGGEHIEILDDHLGSRSLLELVGYPEDWGKLDAGELDSIRRLMTEVA